MSVRPVLEEFLAIIFFERQRNIRVMQPIASDKVTPDEIILLESLIVARWDLDAATRYLKCFLGEASARAAACVAAKIHGARVRRAPSYDSFANALSRQITAPM